MTRAFVIAAGWGLGLVLGLSVVLVALSLFHEPPAQNCAEPFYLPRLPR